MLDQAKIGLRLTLENVGFWFRELIRRNLRKLIEIVITDLDLMGSLRDVWSSSQFEREQLKDAAQFKSRPRLYRYALKEVASENGLFLEFGVYKGDSVNRLAALKPEVRWFGFDSFQGLPDDWTLGSRKGSFSLGGALPPVRDNVTLIKGLFEETLAAFVAQHRNAKAVFVHVDCDIYSATCTVLRELNDILHPNCVIVFDEYFNYAGWQDAEHKAFMEFIAETKRSFDYIGYVRTNGQVAVRLR